MVLVFCKTNALVLSLAWGLGCPLSPALSLGSRE